MKNKLKKLILSIALIFAVASGSICGLLSGILTLSSAEYKPTSVPAKPYDFNDSTGWTKNTISGNTALSDAFANSDVAKNLKDLDTTMGYKPAKNYNGEELSDEDKALVMIANSAPVSVKVDKMDGDKYVYKMDGDKFVYEKDPSDATKDRIYTSAEKDDDSAHKDDYVLVADTTDKYYKKIREQEDKDTYFSYKTTSSLSLSANSYYVVTAYVFTKDAKATLTISDRDYEVSASAKEVGSEGEWQLVWLFFETSASSSTSAYLTLYYGQNDKLTNYTDKSETESGIVIFDHIDVQKISKTEFNNKTIAGKTASEENAVHATGSARVDYDVPSNLNPTFEDDDYITNNQLSVYGSKFGEDGYVEAEANSKYQYYVPKFAGSDGKDRLNERELKAYRDAYSKLSQSIVVEKTDIITKIDATETEEEKTVTYNTFNPNNKALKLKNDSEKYDLGVLSPRFEIKQFAFYRLSVWTKSTDKNANAIIKLLSYIDTGYSNGSNYTDGALQITTQSVTAFTKDDNLNNNWTETIFYIQGNPYSDTTIQLALLAGTESTVYYDAIRLEAITSSTYSNASSSTKFDLGSSTITMENGITNGYFNEITVSDLEKFEDIDAPYTPASWTELENNDSDVTAGVIPTSDTGWQNVRESLGYTSTSEIVNPMAGTELVGASPVLLPRSNILAIYSESEKSYGYKSSSFSLSSNSVYEITFYTYAEKSNFAGTLYANLTFSDDNISEINQKLTVGEGGKWVKHTIYVRIGSASKSVNFVIGTTKSQGTVYFRDFAYNKFSEKTVGEDKITVDQQFKTKLSENKTLALQTANNVSFVDFAGNSGVMHSSSKVQDKDYFESLFYEKESLKENSTKVQGELGVVETNSDLTLESDPSLVISSAFMKRENAISDFAILIYNKAVGETNISPISSTTLSSSSYYQITFYVKTANIEQAKGLTAKMDAISVQFTNINTGALDDANNAYTKFTVLVKTGSSSISNFSIDFSLGETGKEISGIALISDIDIFKFASEKDYNEVVENVDKNDANTIIKDFSSSSDKDKTSDESADSMTLATFFLVFSSILLVIALVVALVGVYIKKLPKSKTIVGTNNANVSKDDNTNTNSKDGFV